VSGSTDGDGAQLQSQLPQSQLTAEQLLTKLIELIINSQTTDDISKATLETTFGVLLTRSDSGGERFAARLTANWNVAISFTNYASSGPIARLAFSSATNDPETPMTDICGIDAEALASALTDASFERSPVFGIHGERWGATFTRGPVRIDVGTGGEASEPSEKITHACIKWVAIKSNG